MKKQTVTVLTILAIAGCGQIDPVALPQAGITFNPPQSQNVVQLNPLTDEPLQLTQPVAPKKPQPVEPPKPSQTQTGSSNLELAQIYPPYLQTQIMGNNTNQPVDVQIEPPPHEISPCYGAVILTPAIQPVAKEYQYNGWWLLATLSKPNYQMGDTTNFYWVTQISSHQSGAVPANHTYSNQLYPPPDSPLNLGYAQLPYQWVTRLEYYSGFPINPDEKCVG